MLELPIPYYSRAWDKRGTDFKFDQNIQRVHPNKSPLKFLEKCDRGRIQVLPNLSGTPYCLWNGKSYGFQIWPVHSQGASEQKPIKNFKKGNVDCPFFSGTPYYLRPWHTMTAYISRPKCTMLKLTDEGYDHYCRFTTNVPSKELGGSRNSHEYPHILYIPRNAL